MKKSGRDLSIRTLLFLLGMVALTTTTVQAQDVPRITALFPAGAKAGETVEVAVRGGSLNGAKGMIVTGAPGVNAELMTANAAVDESAKPLFQAKCTSCHEARSPANRSMTPDQWAATVDRMIQARSADIQKPDRDKIVAYLQASARAGQVMAKVTVSKDAVPGIREIRVVTGRGASTSYFFEVGSLPEITATEPNSKIEESQKVTLPVVVNGIFATSGEKDFFGFTAKKGDRLVFNLKGFRLNEQSQYFFNPVLYLYDAQGKEIAKNQGKYGLDPLIDWVAPADGNYTLLVRDLLWKGSPSSVYRLTMGPVPYDVVLAPEGAARPGASIPARMLGDMMPVSGTSTASLRVPDSADGITSVATPLGDALLLVRDVPNGSRPVKPDAASIALPAVFSGQIAQAGQVDSFKVKSNRPGTFLDVYAKRIGSPLRPKVVVKNAQGQVVAGGEGDGQNELRVNNAFPAPGEYTVEVTDADGRGGSAFAYTWEALDGTPDFTLTATPDCLNIPAGATLPIMVRATRRENLHGPITVKVTNLPPGVVQTDAIIPPDDDKVMVLLTAPPGVAVENRVVTVEATTPADNGAVVVHRARPIEEYKFNNQPRYLFRNSQVVAIASDKVPFTIEWKDGQSEVALPVDAKEATKLSIKIKRADNFKGGVYCYFPAMPPGCYIENWVYIPPEKDEGEFLVRANGGAGFLLRPRPMPDLPTMTMSAVGIIAGGDGSYVSCSPYIKVVPVKK